MSTIKIYLLSLLSLVAFTCEAQIPYRAPKQDSAILVYGAKLHTGTGQVIETGIVEFINGKITFIGTAVDVGDRVHHDKLINATGKHVYPGLIAMNTYLGLTEVEAVRATSDYGEVGQYNADLRSIIAYNADSKVIPTVRSNGVLLAQVVPQGGVISGTSSIVQLDAWNWEDAAYKSDEGIHLNWPSYFSRFNEEPNSSAANDKYDQQVDNIRQYFAQAKAYAQTTNPAQVNLRFEAMKGLFNGQKSLYIRANFVKEIMGAILFARKFEVKLIIVGGIESMKCIDLIKQNNIPIVLHRTQALPITKDDEVYQVYTLPSKLQKAGVQYCISEGGFWQQRNLPFEAGQAAAFGLTQEEALSAITINPARIMGIDKTTGSLEVGKDANLVICDGDILDMQSNHIIMEFIQGRQVDLYNSQEQLYDTYRKKYGIK